AFSPWGWTPGMQRLAQEYQCVIEHPDLSVVRRVNSKLWSYDLENELDVQLAGSAVAATMEDMEVLVRTVAPNPEDKWVIKSPYGFAARDRVLGSGPQMQHAQRKWVERRFKNNIQLLFQPWLDVEREYGVTIVIRRDGTHEF